MPIRWNWRLAGLLAVAVASLLPAQQAAAEYTFSFLGNNTAAYGINGAGQIVGTSSSTGTSYATVFSGGSRIALENPGGTSFGTYSFGYAINNASQAVGYARTSSGQDLAFTWTGTPATQLQALGFTTQAFGINNSGQIVGTTYLGGPGIFATRWDGTSATLLGALGGSYSEARGINDAGQIAGWASISGDLNTHAAIWSGGRATDLGGINPGTSYAYAINNAGQVVGQSVAGPFLMHATLWNGTTATDLGTLGGSVSTASSINNSGQIVGWSYLPTNDQHATLWNGAGGPIDLNSLLAPSLVNAGWQLSAATGINDSGWIAGNALNFRTGESGGFLLAPVPLPATALLLIAGMGLFGLGLRRGTPSRA